MKERSIGTTIATRFGMTSLRVAAVLSLSFGFGALYAGCNKGPVLDGFASGGLAGDLCPPGTVGDGSCGDPDCAVECVATTSCESGEACPTDTVCGTLEGEKWCVPQLCDQGQCEGALACDKFTFSKEVCVTNAPN